MKKFIDFCEHKEYDNDNHYQLKGGRFEYGSEAFRAICIAIRHFCGSFDYWF
ncbi:hypothetical protein LM600983_90034 [Listeria monocytogenes]|nr:hypothetical protein LM500065_80102 [Listeria monocytogenes]CUK75069.1 hypothetical protein LM600983_90034 [Listeria monocytogenes]CUL57090.1 hypothetical protein LM800235_30142 [Listeria monocytogenes]